MHDPGHVILRRALRVGLLVPLTYLVVQVGLGWSNAALASAFACFSMLAFADLGGPRRERMTANALLGINGVVLIALGSYLAQWQTAVVGATLVIVFVIAYSAVLRGYFAAATAAAILPWVFAATATPDPSLSLERAAGWAIGAAVATIGSGTLWPMFVRSSLRLRLADVLSAAADVVSDIGHPQARAAAFTKLQEADTALHDAYDGRLARPGAGTARDRSLMQAIDETRRLITTLEFTHAYEPELGPIDAQLSAAIVVALKESAEALRAGDVIPDPAKLDAQRAAHAQALAAWCQSTLNAGLSAKVRPGVEGSATLRMLSLTAEAMTIYVRGAMDRAKSVSPRGRKESDGEGFVTFAGYHILEPERRVSPRTLLARQFTFQSPWLQTALRTSVAITLTVYVVSLLGAEHGFWASLGALVALKFDASGTQRAALPMVLGTIIGFAVGSGLILLAGVHPTPLWFLLPIVTFLAAYTPGAVSFVIGQASFSVFVIILLGITEPDQLDTAKWRLADVLIGLGVSLFVSLLMWPHGVAPMVYQNARKAIYAATNYLMYGYERIVDGATSGVHADALERDSMKSVQRANESFDLAFSQQGPGLANSRALVAALNVASALNYYGEVLGGLSQAGHLADSCGASGDSMLAAAHRVGTRIISIVNLIGNPDAPYKDATSADRHRIALERLRATIDSDFASLEPAVDADGASTNVDVGYSAMLLVLALVWIIQSVWLADQLEAVVPTASDS